MRSNSILYSLIVFASITFSGCRDATLTTGDGSNVVKASGKVKTEERTVSAFNKISLEGVFNVYLLQKDEESVRLQADESVLPNIITEVKGNVLTVKLKDDSKFEKMGNITVYISLKDISELKTKGVGLVHSMDTLNLKTVALILQGVGATKLNLNCEQLSVTSQLVGSLTLSGSAKEFNVWNKGIGGLKAFDFKAEKVSIESEGIGKAEVFASESIYIDAKGLGGVAYKGNPSSKDIQNEGVGVVASSN